MSRLPTFFIPHGGGPCFFMDPPAGWPPTSWDRMAAFLCELDALIGRRPRAVIIVSGHWEARQPTVNNGVSPPLLFDYSGFPAHTYELTWPAPGAPDVADEIIELLEGAGFVTNTDNRRGYDHGVFIPFKLVYPDADVPVVQLSLLASRDPVEHLTMGRALASLRDRNILIVGSGMSYHNIPNFFSGRGNDAATAFDAWLGDVIIDPGTREVNLANWQTAPAARLAHPEAEHLLPLLVAAGAGTGEVGVRIYHDRIVGKPFSAFQFG
ncbi:DODA-type extradiol aromatic ring-opening family dioxygenase [Pseudomonas syringae]|uniref:Dioxygenase n=1 Tax=Pseudomonas syringae pv. papulans TaxID=83963 RepID=A0AA43IVA5_PSESX|nr:class III extradiol ring-cleavage dioxygenase [Pseudomonas syringae]KWS32804.1 dioxygenase [Pseudomonas syringae pv. papulans]MDH4606319.1 dioxygenase [Pseudomonas syringae pv. papulans]MDH4623134.1 dioxygenase [Pseudomonas syringae pv. papulans]